MLTGPQNMPNFPDTTMPAEQKQAIIKYIEHLQRRRPTPAAWRSGPTVRSPRACSSGRLASARSSPPRCGSGRRCDERHPRARTSSRSHGDEPLFPLRRTTRRASPTPTRARPGAPSARSPSMFGLSALLHRRVRRRSTCTSRPTASSTSGPSASSRLVQPRCSASASARAILLIGAGAIHWAKKLMADEEIVDERHPVGSPQEDKDAALGGVRAGHRRVGLRRAQARPPHADRRAGALPGPPDRPAAATWARCPATRCATPIWRKGSRIVVDVTQPAAPPRGPPRRHAGLRLSRGPGRRCRRRRAPRTPAPRPRSSSCACAPRRSARSRARTGTTRASSRSPRSAPTSAARSRSTSSARTTCSARATSRPSTSPTRATSSSGRPARRMPQLPITVDAEGYLVAAERLPGACRPELLGARMSVIVKEAGKGHLAAPTSGRRSRRCSRPTCARSSPTTGRSCWARSRSTRSSSCCSPASTSPSGSSRR